MRQRVLLFGTLAALTCLLFADGMFRLPGLTIQTAAAQDPERGAAGAERLNRPAGSGLARGFAPARSVIDCQDAGGRRTSLR